MRYLTFAPETNTYPVALLTRYLRERELVDHVKGFEQDVVAYALTTPQKNAKNSDYLAYVQLIFPALCRLQTEYLLITDGGLFKFLTKVKQVDRHVGYVLPCTLEGFKHFNVVYLPSPQQMMYDPSLNQKLIQGLHGFNEHRAGKYLPPGTNIIQFEEYPSEIEDIKHWLDKLLDVDLVIDLETFDLKHYNAGIGTISMAWSQTEGIAFAVDKDNSPSKQKVIRKLLTDWFIKRRARTLYHNASFDIYVLVYQLFMKNLLDTEGLLTGLDMLMHNWDDTQLITYLATNNCAGNELGLKAQSQEYAGNYMVDVKDISQVPLAELLRYNLVDGLATWFVLDKHWDTLVADQQLEIYQQFKDYTVDIIQMQLTGLPIDAEEVQRGKATMLADRNAAVAIVRASPVCAQVEQLLNQKWVEKRNEALKVKRVTMADAKEVFNLNSPLQIQQLLHEVMGLPILETTDTGQPGTGMKQLKNLMNHTKNAQYLEVLKALVQFKEVDKILTSFIPAFEAAPLAPDGHHYLYGFYNLGGTLSGRLSSNGPNMQNLPSSGTRYAKIIKKMFKAPKGWLFVGLDYASLEDRISALTTKDPNKLKVYTDGYDGHSLRAFGYFGDRMPDIFDNVASINSIADLYPHFRQDSKAPTFALTYQGTWRTLMVNCGFSEAMAKMIEMRYHAMYQVSDLWVQDKLADAAKCGYVTVAFGLRLRTPMLKHSVLGTRQTIYAATAEGRTAGNALGQSYGLLNSRSACAFGKKVRPSKWRLDIKLCAQIHDAQYYLVRNDADLLAWMNQELVEEVKWQELPEIQHDDVKLGGELSVFYPTWCNELTIPNGADADQILQLAREHMQ